MLDVFFARSLPGLGQHDLYFRLGVTICKGKSSSQETSSFSGKPDHNKPLPSDATSTQGPSLRFCRNASVPLSVSAFSSWLELDLQPQGAIARERM